MRLLIALLLLAGCAPPPKPVYIWYRERDGSMEFARRDNAVCTNQAMLIASSNPYVLPEVPYQNCMVGKGWVLSHVKYE